MTTDDRAIALAFNEWMRRYIEEPERFQREWRSIEEFKCEEADGEVPDYGGRCVEMLNRLLAEVAKGNP